MTTTARPLRVMGQRLPKVDAVDKVTGRSLFGADVKLPGMLVGKLLRSPYAHARITRIDTTRAEALPGVMAVITARDMPEIAPGTRVSYGGAASADIHYLSRLILARDKVLFHGHPVAAVAAISPELAEEALGLIEVEYEPLALVLDTLEAMKPGSTLIHNDNYTQQYDLFRQKVLGKADSPSNVAMHMTMVRGDVEKGFAEADVVIERTYRSQMVHQGYIEPEAETAEVHPDGSVVVWANTQGIFSQRNELSVLLGVPLSKIKVVPTEVGGAFGGKIHVRVSPLCVLLSKKSGRPVQITLSREEVLRATGPGSPTTMTVKVGANKDGAITALQAHLVYDAGSFPGAPLYPAIRRVFSVYHPPNLKIDAYDVVTNKPKVADYRAPGGTPTAFAVESVIDEVAEALGMDKIEFRLKNVSRTGDLMPDGVPLPRVGLVEVLEAVKRHPCWTPPLNGRDRGRGIALGLWAVATATASCHVVLNGDGTVSLVLGTVDLSATRTTLAQVAAEELGLEVADVRVLTSDTDSVAYSESSSGDKVTYVASAAVRTACQDLLNGLRRRVAEQFKVPMEDVVYQRKRFWVRGAPEMEMALAEVAAKSITAGGQIAGYGTASGMKTAPMAAAHVVDVEVDRETGKVKILSYTAFQDAGLAVNPTAVEGQMQGGVVQGIGWALTEEYLFDEKGALRNANLLDYRIPTALDVPFIGAHIIEVPSPDNPYGLRGAGQAPIVPPAAAIANAIYQATGFRLRELPMNPERVFWALHATQKGGAS